MGAPDTIAWWASHPEAWEACRKEPVEPVDAMRDYLVWVETLGGRPVLVA